MPDLFLKYFPLLAQGLGITLFLALTVMASALVLGLGFTILRVYRVPIAAPLANGYVYLIRSMPLVMLIGLIHFAVLPMMGIAASFLLSAYVALTLSTTAYLSEILRGGFQALHQEEQETAISLGLTFFQRLVYVLIPLVLTRMMPALVNQFVTLLKDTSLASIIGVIELMRAAEIIYERTLHEFEMLALVAVLYFALCYNLSRMARHLETSATHRFNMLNWLEA